MKKMLLLPICMMLLASCGGNTDTTLPISSLNSFLTSLESHNFTAEIGDYTYEFYGADALAMKIAGNTTYGGYMRNSYGVFEYTVHSNSRVDTEGMLSSNHELSPYDFVSTPADLLYINSELWQAGKTSYYIEGKDLDDQSVLGVYYGFSLLDLSKSKLFNNPPPLKVPSLFSYPSSALKIDSTVILKVLAI